MIRISKKIEYGLLAVKYIAGKKGELVAVKEISDNLGIPFEFLAKTLQKLAKSGIAKSYQGVSGGYKLIKTPDEITIFEIINAIEGRKGLVKCFTELGPCAEKKCFCEIKGGMLLLQNKIENLLQNTYLTELIAM